MSPFSKFLFIKYNSIWYWLLKFITLQHGESALFLAVCNGHLKISESLLKAGAKVAYTAKCEVSCNLLFLNINILKGFKTILFIF